MKEPRRDTQETRRRLLEAAGMVFAEKGFWEASNADICKRARVNTAAVSYHFGGKENLYVEAWKYAFKRSVEAHPTHGGIPANAPASERLHGYLLALIHRILDPDNYEVEIMHKEMANPTGLLTEAIRLVLEPMREETKTLVCELLGDKVSALQVDLCEMSIMSQCFGPILRLRHTRKKADADTAKHFFNNISVEIFANHVLQFSLAGLRSVRRAATTKQTRRQ
jgi:AcrR family transcriptional regulator